MWNDLCGFLSPSPCWGRVSACNGSSMSLNFLPVGGRPFISDHVERLVRIFVAKSLLGSSVCMQRLIYEPELPACWGETLHLRPCGTTCADFCRQVPAGVECLHATAHL